MALRKLKKILVAGRDKLEINPISFSVVDWRGVEPLLPTVKEKIKQTDISQFAEALENHFPEATKETVLQHFFFSFVCEFFLDNVSDLINNSFGKLTILEQGKRNNCIVLWTNSISGWKQFVEKILVKDSNNSIELKLAANKIVYIFDEAGLSLIKEFTKIKTDFEHFEIERKKI